MQNNILTKGLVLGIIILFLGTCIFPKISASIENKYKTDLSESSLQSPLDEQFFVLGFMKILNKTADYLEVENIFGLWMSLKQYGGFFEPNEHLYINGFLGITIGVIVFGTYDNITRP